MKLLSESKRLKFQNGIQEIHRIQAKHFRRLTVDSAKKVTERIIQKVGLKEDKRENYFRLLAICAFINTEPLHRYWKERKCKATKRLSFRKSSRCKR